jgi:hypothetical protein
VINVQESSKVGLRTGRRRRILYKIEEDDEIRIVIVGRAVARNRNDEHDVIPGLEYQKSTVETSVNPLLAVVTPSTPCPVVTIVSDTLPESHPIHLVFDMISRSSIMLRQSPLNRYLMSTRSLGVVRRFTSHVPATRLLSRSITPPWRPSTDGGLIARTRLVRWLATEAAPPDGGESVQVTTLSEVSCSLPSKQYAAVD